MTWLKSNISYVLFMTIWVILCLLGVFNYVFDVSLQELLQITVHILKLIFKLWKDLLWVIWVLFVCTGIGLCFIDLFKHFKLFLW